MSWRSKLKNGLLRTLEGRGFDRGLVGESVLDTGEQGQRARAIGDRLNASRPGLLDKQPVVAWKLPNHAAVTKRGRWLYLAMPFVQRLSDDGLAFVIAHEMAHHDLGHVAHPIGTLAAIARGPQAELDADQRALEICVEAGFDPRGGLEALGREHFEDEDESELSWWSRLTRTHPPTEERLAAIEAWIRDRGHARG